MAKSDKSERNPARYRLASEPHESHEALQKAVEGFWNEVGELRLKYKISNVFIVSESNAITSDGTEGAYQSMHGYGDSTHWLALSAIGYGHERRRHNELMGKLLSLDED